MCEEVSGKLPKIISDDQRYERMYVSHITRLDEAKKRFFETLTAGNVSSRDSFDSLRIDFSVCSIHICNIVIHLENRGVARLNNW